MRSSFLHFFPTPHFNLHLFHQTATEPPSPSRGPVVYFHCSYSFSLPLQYCPAIVTLLLALRMHDSLDQYSQTPPSSFFPHSTRWLAEAESALFSTFFFFFSFSSLHSIFFPMTHAMPESPRCLIVPGGPRLWLFGCPPMVLPPPPCWL